MATLQVIWGNTRKVQNGSKKAEPPDPKQILVFWKDAMNRFRESLIAVDVCYLNRGVTLGELWQLDKMKCASEQNQNKHSCNL